MAENTTTLIKFLGEEGTQAFVKNVKDLCETKANVNHTHTEIDNKISELDTSISNITSGTTTVKESEHASTADKATNADSATNSENAEKATKDSAGNIITDTYETKEDANAKLTEAKNYTDELLVNYAEKEHIHEIADVTGLQEHINTSVYIDIEDNVNVEDVEENNTDIIVDDFLSETSVNPVQNKIVTEKVNQLQQEIDEQTTQIETLLESFGITKSINILPKDSLSGYYSTDNGTTVISGANFRRTPEKIPVTSKTLYIMINPERVMKENCLVAIPQFNDAGQYIRTLTVGFSEAGSIKTVSLDNTTVQVYVWTNNNLELSDVCIGEETYGEFQEYGASVSGDTSWQQKIFYGKTIVNFGDSIFGNRRPPNDISTRLAELTGATVHNCGFGGCRMAQHHISDYDAFSMYRLADSIVSKDWSLQDVAVASDVPYYFDDALAILKKLDFSKVDIITIAYGTNDFTSDVNLDNTDNPHDTTTFAGALRYSVEKLLGAYPHLKIFVCSQTYRFWMDENNVFTEDSDTRQNGDGKKLTDFAEKTEEMTKELHLPYINNYNIGMNKYNRGYYFSATDGTHPLTVGCHLIAEHIAKELF